MENNIYKTNACIAWEAEYSVMVERNADTNDLVDGWPVSGDAIAVFKTLGQDAVTKRHEALLTDKERFYFSLPDIDMVD